MVVTINLMVLAAKNSRLILAMLVKVKKGTQVP